MGFQRQLCEFEKLLSLKKSYSSPNRVDKVTAKLVQGTFSSNGAKQLKNLSVIKGPAASHNNSMMVDPGQTIGANFFDKEMPQQNDFARVTFFDRSNELGFSDDKLGRLAEINKTQLEQALRDMSFARTDAGFNHR